MMVLRFVQTIEVTPTEDLPQVGMVPLVGKSIQISRAWCQCDQCGLIGAFEQMASPMMPPPCAQGCDDPVT